MTEETEVIEEQAQAPAPQPAPVDPPHQESEKTSPGQYTQAELAHGQQILSELTPEAVLVCFKIPV